MPGRPMPVVQTAGLCKTFKDFWRRPSVEAVKNLDIEIKPGEVFGLLGPNGSGKTTTIKLLLGLLYPTRGRISIFGKSPTDVAVKARIGFLPEESYLYRFLVADETLDFYGRMFQLPKHVRRERSDRLLDMVGLRFEAGRPVGEYSKGMARRIGLAQALINDPELLILDEPTSGLDPVGARQIKDVIRELGRKGKTILLSSHVLSDVEDVCDRVTILYGGQQRAVGDIGELLRERDVTQITAPALMPETIEQLRRMIRKLERKDILTVSNPRQKLEDFFLKIVEEAQVAKVRTSGATAGGEIPDFLKKPTEAARDVVETLVTAAERKLEAPPAVEETEPERERGPEEDVLGKLLSERAEPASEGEAKEPAREAPAPAKPQAPVSADHEVIDSLIKRGGVDGGEQSESSS